MQQRILFSQSEGDAWHKRNQGKYRPDKDPVLSALIATEIAPTSVLEIGCGGGDRLVALRDYYGAECEGIDPSLAAIQAFRNQHADDILVRQADAAQLPCAVGAFDLVIFGFCLYLTDPVDHFRIVAEADRVLADGGTLVIHDFLTERPIAVPYKHCEGVFSHKFEWSRVWRAHPAYRLVARRYSEHGSPFTFDEGEAVCVDILRKSLAGAFQRTQP